MANKRHSFTLKVHLPHGIDEQQISTAAAEVIIKCELKAWARRYGLGELNTAVAGVVVQI